MARRKYVTVKIPLVLVEDMDKLIGKHGYTSRGEIAKEGIRRVLKDYEEGALMRYPRLEEVSFDGKTFKILDRKLLQVVDVNVNVNPKPWCSLCEVAKCEHVDFAFCSIRRRTKGKKV